MAQTKTNEDKLTILIIAHRLTSIQDAKNLLFIEKRDCIRNYEKGTKGYDIMFAKLKNITYVNAEGEEEEEEVQRLNSIVASSHHSRNDSKSMASFRGLDSEITKEMMNH